jgi:hypothetical protein
MNKDKECLNWDDNRMECMICDGYSEGCMNYECEDTKAENTKGLLHMLKTQKERRI